MSAPQMPSFNAPAQGKSRMIAGILAFFLGYFGAAEFYLGHKKYAFYRLGLIVALIVLNILTAVTGSGFLSTIAGLFTFALGLLNLVLCVLTFMGKWIYEKDANGVPTV